MDLSVGVILVLLVGPTLKHQSFLDVNMWGSSPFPPCNGLSYQRSLAAKAPSLVMNLNLNLNT